MSILLANQFEVDPRPGQTTRQCLLLIRHLVASWISRKCGRKESNPLRIPFDGSAITPKPGHVIWTNQQDSLTHQLATLEWCIPEPPPPSSLRRHDVMALRQEFVDECGEIPVCRFSCVLACDDKVIEVAMVVELCFDDPIGTRIEPCLNRTNPCLQLRSELQATLVRVFRCRLAGQPIRPDSTSLTEHTPDIPDEGAVSVDQFVERSLFSPDRRLAVVVVAEADEMVRATPDSFEYRGLDARKKGLDWDHTSSGFKRNVWEAGYGNPHVVRGEQEPIEWTFLDYLQTRLLGHAQVVSVDRGGAARLAELLGRERAVEVPGVRLYWPDFRRDTPPADCPSYGMAELKQMVCRIENSATEPLERTLYLELAKRSSEVFREGPIIRAARVAVALEAANTLKKMATLTTRLSQVEADLEQAQQTRERFRRERDAAQRQLETIQRELTSLKEQFHAVREDPSPNRDLELESELERAWDENARLQAEINDQRRQVAALELELRAARENLSRLWQAPPEVAPPIPVETRSFENVAEAVDTAAMEFADILTVWDDAVRSAERSLFTSPLQVYRAIAAIVEVGRAYFSARSGGPSPGPLEQAFQRRVPFKYTGFESQSTMSLYGAERVFRNGGLSRQMQRHLTLGRGGQTNNCLQIYFEFEEGTERVLIGYCGRHLPHAGQRT